MSAPIPDPVLDFRQRVEEQMAPFDPTPWEIELLVAAQGDVVATAAIFAAVLGRLECEAATLGLQP